MPLLNEAAAMIRSYLAAERDRGHIAPDADLATIGLTLIGSGHLISAASDGGAPEWADVHRVVVTVLAGAAPGVSS